MDRQITPIKKSVSFNISQAVTGKNLYKELENANKNEIIESTISNSLIVQDTINSQHINGKIENSSRQRLLVEETIVNSQAGKLIIEDTVVNSQPLEAVVERTIVNSQELSRAPGEMSAKKVDSSDSQLEKSAELIKDLDLKDKNSNENGPISG